MGSILKSRIASVSRWIHVSHFNFLQVLNFLHLFAGGGVLSAPKDLNADAPGEMGRPVFIPTNLTAETKKLVDDGWLNNAFNQYASDLISVHRTLPDPRDQW